MYLEIKHVRDFINRFSKSNHEYLLIWLNNFNFYDQMCLIYLFTKYKLTIFKFPTTSNLHDGHCKCFELYNQLPEQFRLKFPDLSIFQKCVYIESETTQQVPTISFNPNIEQTTEDVKLEFYKESKCPTNLFYNNTQIDVNMLTSKFETILADFDLKNTHQDFNYSLPIKFLKTHSLLSLIPYINVLEMYTIFIIKFVFNVRDFEALIPEYWRTLNRKIYNKKTQSPFSTLCKIYGFYSGKTLLDHNTNTKATFKLAYTIPINSTSELKDVDEYVIQPRFSGVRLLICKTTSCKILIRNVNNIKVKLNLNLFSKINLDDDHTFTGEFMIMLYNSVDGNWLSKTELIDYMMQPNKDPGLKIYLYVLDLFLWNGVVLTTISYQQRCVIIKAFIEKYHHNNLFRQVVEIKNVAELEQLYDTYLTTLDSTAPPFTGAIFRKRFKTFTFKIPYVLFKKYKIMLYKNYSMENIIMSTKNNIKMVEKNTTIIPISNNSKIVLTFLCFNIVDQVLFLAIQQGLEYIHFLNISIFARDLVGISNFKNIKVTINGIDYTGFMINVGFKTLFTNVAYIIPRPDKSLIDCVTRKNIDMFKSNSYYVKN
ncbi:KN57_gp048 [Dikerogammarus haemobaphes nudivirus]|nr:KN57_gp048 [Dikerogammarus haemobaphes nudivirus]